MSKPDAKEKTAHTATGQNLQQEPENAQQPVMAARHVTRKYLTVSGETVTAVNDVSLSLYKGKTLGLVGESGCGKSTFLRCLVSLDQPSEGEILYHGQDITKMKGEQLRQNRQYIQMVFQDPGQSMSPKMKVRDIISEPLLNFHKITKKEVKGAVEKLLAMVELPPEMADRYPHMMSGGQQQRVAIARALALEPEVIVLDEATCALDVSVQKTIVELITRLQREKNITMCFVCHDIALVQSLAHTIAVMYLGRVVEILPGDHIRENALHPYTQALLGSVFDIHSDLTQKISLIRGEPPSPTHLPPGCPFADRCEHCMPQCHERVPALRKIEEGHQVACHLYTKT